MHGSQGGHDAGQGTLPRVVVGDRPVAELFVALGIPSDGQHDIVDHGFEPGDHVGDERSAAQVGQGFFDSTEPRRATAAEDDGGDGGQFGYVTRCAAARHRR